MIIIGHRGAMGYEPENTLRSFQKALDLNVDMIEFDVHLCASGEIVVIHDEKINRTTDGKGLVAEKSLAELKELDAGKGKHIPTLEEVLDLIDGRVKVNIELKGDNTAKAVSKVIKEYESTDLVVSSFNHEELKKFHELSPEIKIAVLVDDVKEEHIDLARELKAISINPDIERIDNKVIERVHRKGFKIIVWSFNDIKDTNGLNFDGAFLNYPDKLGN
jgi:glycerophosphoryl diester phosphodiesterase